jgi:hypothetical protein
MHLVTHHYFFFCYNAIIFVGQALHPHISSWGSLLRLYGSHSLKTVKEKKQEEQQITLLQSKAAVNAPNHAILNKLREEMLKLRQMRVRNIFSEFCVFFCFFFNLENLLYILHWFNF